MVKKSYHFKNVALSKENVDIEDALDEAGHGRYNYFLLATSCMITVGATMDMLGYSLVVPAASCELDLTLEQGGMIKSIGFAGTLLEMGGQMVVAIIHFQGQINKIKETLGSEMWGCDVKSLMQPDIILEPTSFWDSVVKQTTPVFKPPILWRTLQLFLLLSISCSTNNAFFMWFPTMVDSLFTSSNDDTNFCQKIVASIETSHNSDNCSENNTKNMIYAGLILTLIATVCNFVLVIFADWRRTTIIGLFAIAAVGCAILNMFADRYISLVLFCLIEFTGLAIGSVYSYYVDVYPTSYRGLATGLGTMVGRTVSLGGVAVVGTTIINHCHLTFYCWSGFVLSGIIATVFLPNYEIVKKNVIV